jgi:hypothetical protein
VTFRILGGSSVALALGLLVGCSSSDTTFEAVVTPAVQAIAKQVELRLFRGAGCDPLVITGGQPDRVRTATASFKKVFAPGDAVKGTLAASDIGQLAALEVRAVDALGIPLATRCAPIDPSVSGVKFQLAQLAPSGAKVSVEQSTALLSGTARQDIRVVVHDAMDAPAAEVPIAIGPAWPITLTSSLGVASIPTPTTAPSLDQALRLEVYGVPGMTWPARATVLAAPSCPAAAWTSDPLWPEATSGVVSLGRTADRIVLVRPEGTGRAVDLFAPSAGVQLMRVATSTRVPTEADGPLAAAIDARDQSLLVAIGTRGGRITTLRWDPSTRRFDPPRTLAFLGTGTGGSDPVEALAFLVRDADGLDLFASASEHAPAVERFTATSTPGVLMTATAALPSGDDAPARDLAFGRAGSDAADGLIVTVPGELRIYALAAGAISGSPRRLGSVSGQIALGKLAPELETGAQIILADRDSGASPSADDLVSVIEVGASALNLLFRGPAGPGASAALVADQNGDQRPDLLIHDGDANTEAIFASDGRGHFVRGSVCQDDNADGSGPMIAFDVDGDGRPEAVEVASARRALVVKSVGLAR